MSYRRRRCGRETRACFVQRLHGVRIELRPHVRAVSPPNWEVEAVRSVRARLRSRQWTVGCLRALPRKESETGEGGAAVSKMTCWVYAKNEAEAMAHAEGRDGYGPWDDEAQAVRDGDGSRDECRLTGEVLFRVTTEIVVVAEKVLP